MMRGSAGIPDSLATNRKTDMCSGAAVPGLAVTRAEPLHQPHGVMFAGENDSPPCCPRYADVAELVSVQPTATPQHTEPPPPHAAPPPHAERARRARWATRCAALAPMRPQDIASTAAIHRCIDARRSAIPRCATPMS